MMAVFSDDSDGKSTLMSKVSKKRRLIYSEDTYRERLGCIRGDLHLIEHMYIVASKTMELPEQPRTMYNLVSKTTRGDTSGPILFKSWTEIWKATVQDKRAIYGASNRVAIGGSGPDADASAANRKSLTDLEPIVLHSMPVEFYFVMFQEVPPAAVIDLTPGDGSMAVASLLSKVPYLGVGFTQRHADGLLEHVQATIFAEMCKETSKLYDPSLAKVLASIEKKKTLDKTAVKQPEDPKNSKDPKETKGQPEHKEPKDKKDAKGSKPEQEKGTKDTKPKKTKACVDLLVDLAGFQSRFSLAPCLLIKLIGESSGVLLQRAAGRISARAPDIT